MIAQDSLLVQLIGLVDQVLPRDAFLELPHAVVFLPGVHKVEDAVMRSYALPQLLVYPHTLR